MRPLYHLINKTVKQITLLTTILLLTILSISAQNAPDPLFPGKGKSAITIGTGIPLVGIAEYSYGISDRFSVGIFAAHAIIEEGYGLRLRSVLYQKQENFRVSMRFTNVYYPGSRQQNGEPWVLTWPAANAEWKLPSGLGLSAGIGLIASSCVDDLFGEHEVDHHSHHHHEHGQGHEEDDSMNGVWSTIQLGLTVPMGKRMTFMTEISSVGNGFKIPAKDWLNAIPAIFVAGIVVVL